MIIIMFQMKLSMQLLQDHGSVGQSSTDKAVMTRNITL